jgi:TrmH family RNA methyltransferase
MIEARLQYWRWMAVILGRAEHQNHAGWLRFIDGGLSRDANRKICDIDCQRGRQRHRRVPDCAFHYATLIVNAHRDRMSETITSASNPLLKDVKRALARGVLTREGLCVAETFHLLEEARRSACHVSAVLAAESARAAAEGLLGRSAIRFVVLPDSLFQSLSDTETAQGVMALVKPREWQASDLVAGVPLIVVLDGVQDPGNAGAILRAAEAFGATGAIFLKGAVSPYNPKTIRASAGSIFRLPFLHAVGPAASLAIFREHQLRLFAAMPAHGNGATQSLASASLASNCGIVIGSEAHGVSPELRAKALPISIPTVGVESLNAAVAAGILLYEARRQRTLRS